MFALFREDFHFLFVSSAKMKKEVANFRKLFELPEQESTLFVLPDKKASGEGSSCTLFKQEKTFEKIRNFLRAYRLALEQMRKKKEEQRAMEDTSVHALELENFQTLCPSNANFLCVVLMQGKDNSESSQKVVEKLAVKYKKDKLKFMKISSDSKFLSALASMIDCKDTSKSTLVVYNPKRSKYSVAPQETLNDESSASLFVDSLLSGNLRFHKINQQKLAEQMNQFDWFSKMKSAFNF